jgi:hypothetical protein
MNGRDIVLAVNRLESEAVFIVNMPPGAERDLRHRAWVKDFDDVFNINGLNPVIEKRLRTIETRFIESIVP